MINLKGFYNINVLQKMLYEGQITQLDYVMHHTEEDKKAFLDFCQERKIEVDNDAAQQFLEKTIKDIERAHINLLD